jgi:hypothetical protein
LVIDNQFDEFWALWPRKVAKLNAQKAWAKATKKVSSGVILPAVLAYAKSVRGKDQQYIAHPATWLNGERWNDFTQSAAPTPKARDPFDVEPAGWQVAAREAGML